MSFEAVKDAAVVEILESRQLLSGDVLVSITDTGDLMVRGDKAGNSIAVTAALDGSITITGNAGTTVNGGTDPVALTGVTGNVFLKMGDGSDDVSVTGLTIAGGMKFDGGKGDNNLLVDSTTMVGNLQVKNRLGSQSFTLQNASSVGGNLMISNVQRGDTATTVDASTVTGKFQVNNKVGADTLVLTASTLGTVKVNNHKGDSATTIDACTIGGNLFLYSMKGADTIDVLNGTTVAEKTKIKTGYQGADITLAGLSTASLQVMTGKGADQVSLDGVAVTGTSLIRTGMGDDTITIANSLAPGFAGPAKIDSGHGNDTMDVTAAFADSVTVIGGKGEDSLTWLATSTFAVTPVVVQVETEA